MTTAQLPLTGLELKEQGIASPARHAWQFGDSRLPERFWRKVRINSVTGCWDWTGQVDSYGYGVIRAGTMVKAHRTAYEFSNGPIPAGLTIDHCCHNGTGCPGGTSCPHRACVNSAHMEAVAFGVNVLRGDGPSARAARQTHCINGHEFDEKNTLIAKNGARRCRACDRFRHRLIYQAKKQAQPA